ncbi:transcriptional regulator family: Fungal Specific TF [Penicillium roqueforti]|uniref:transcriptional regulator family: Fungal Specific TF n=1 Tax=Penicillium roqueforti TaxID=5082 RepID=UPI00190D909D|nr:transcriptional regulator family: Fungal Specific TF [Penicillium roqueforti]KAF9242681.1 transcriptional regulator family: Fungal Specific TF [Penicillium roqueforti]KAI1830613.1 transcriptional regulator family: Fungal Specific TF [Penicillium roqueforti]KAI2674303.1 transcriptional regulator family: Fungal Specific TF [Penicillium roqueforti]KAI2684040.1 transcriptional regulator family: Fungal Specific TF [Penicillium roqueforti]KAI2696742.1 transcriptional regulator family: Fungal Spec
MPTAKTQGLPFLSYITDSTYSLQCDDTRPCQLCIRSDAECTDVINKRRRKNTRAQSQSRKPPENRPLLTETAPSHDPSPGLQTHVGPGGNHATDLVTSQRERAHSTFHHAQELFRNHMTTLRDSDAIPDGAPANKLPQVQGSRIPIFDIIGMQLPSTPVTLALLDAYLQANHWYLSMFHEPSFRARLVTILRTEGILPCEKSFLLLLLAVLILGARFSNHDTLHSLDSQFNLQQCKATWIKAVEDHIFWILKEATLESIACAVLMSIEYLLERKTQLSFTMSGLGSRAAQAMSLHDEATWEPLDFIEIQVRRRVWWSIYMVDVYIAQAYGKPSVLPTVQFNVCEPKDLDDTMATCPGIGSYEVREDGTFKPVTIFSYNRYKAQLYSIADPTAHSIRLPHIKRTYARLLDWEKTVPRELKLGSFSEDQSMIDDPARRVFSLQALTLQVSYDYKHLILFRPFLLSRKYLSVRLHDGPIESQDRSDTTIRDQLFTSALRMSSICRWQNILSILGNTTSAVQLCFQCFTAGVVLAMLALSELSSPRLSECKQGLARLIKSLEVAGSGSPLSRQSVDILMEAMHLISAEEVKELVSRAGKPAEDLRDVVSDSVTWSADSCGASDAQHAMQPDAVHGPGIWAELDLTPDESEPEILNSISLYQSLASLF